MTIDMLRELSIVWQVTAEMGEGDKPGRRETLRECADMLQMLLEADPATSVLRHGHTTSSAVNDFVGPKVTLRYTTLNQADAAHAALRAMIGPGVVIPRPASAEPQKKYQCSLNGVFVEVTPDVASTAATQPEQAEDLDSVIAELPGYAPDRSGMNMEQHSDGIYVLRSDVQEAMSRAALAIPASTAGDDAVLVALEFYAKEIAWDAFVEDEIAAQFDRNEGSDLGRDRGAMARAALNKLRGDK